jgi:DNA-binding MarR family transcriptional regulator
MSKHYPLTAELAKQLRSAKLTAAEWQVWTYLVTLDPFGDRYQELDLMTILTDCDISKPTLYRAIARLQELELIDTQPVKFAFRNLVGARNLLSENSIKDDTPV